MNNIESWLPAIFGLVGVLIGSLFSLWLTKLQLNNADKRFERELSKAKEDAQRHRKWEVRSVPLFKLRDELARMATKLQILITDTRLPRSQSAIPEEERQRALQNWRDYVTSGEFLPTIYLQDQDDEEILKLVQEIESQYMLLFQYALDFSNLDNGERKAFNDISQDVRNKIPKVQSLINKRLKEL